MKKLIIFVALLSLSDFALAKHYKIKIKSMKFIPNTLTMKVGDTVTWINVDIGIHAVNSKSFNSGSIRVKKNWTFTATEAGEFKYNCIFHTGMKGVLKVE